MRITCFLLSATLIFPPNLWSAVVNLANVLQGEQEPQSSPAVIPQEFPSYADHQTTLDRAESLIAGIQSHLNRQAFDFEALLDSLDYDAGQIIDFSKRSIAFEQYAGVLRGPKGTLLSRAGNSIDQAVLLAKLLRDAGYDARIAGSQLTTKQGELVLQAMKQPIVPAPPIGDAAGLLGVLQQHGIVSDVGPELKSAYKSYLADPKSAQTLPVYESVIDTSKDLLERLKEAGVSLDSPGRGLDLITEARDYYWVQYRDGAADLWTDVHPVFSEGSPLSELEVRDYFADAVPTELLHKIRIQAFIERKVGDRLEALAITDAWEIPVANLYGVPITFSIYADSMLGSVVPQENLEGLLESAKFFAPVIGASIGPNAQFFDLRATLIDPLAASSPAAGVFAEINRSFSDAIAGIDGEAAVPTLTAQWLELTLTGPNREARKIKRTTFDRIGEAARKNNSVPDDLSPTTLEDARTLLQQHTIIVNSGGLPMAFILQSAAESFRNLRPGVETILDKYYGKPARQRPLSDVPVGWNRQLLLQSLLTLASTLGPGHRTYRSGPAIAIHSFGLGRKGHLLERVDIVSNPRRAVDVGPEVPTLDPALMVRSGVWETAVEGLLLPADAQFNTMSVFAAASENHVDTVVLIPGRAKESTSVSADILAAVDSDLANGYAVIIPKASPQPDRFGWWRVNMETGETLGQIADGRGATVAEYILFTISIAGLIYGSFQCIEEEGGAEWGGDMRQISSGELCCIGVNGLWTTASFALGLWVARVPAELATTFVRLMYEAVGITFSLGMDAAGIYFPIDAICD